MKKELKMSLYEQHILTDVKSIARNYRDRAIVYIFACPIHRFSIRLTLWFESLLKAELLIKFAVFGRCLILVTLRMLF